MNDEETNDAAPSPSSENDVGDGGENTPVRKSTLFKPGQSGNPAGRPKQPKTVKEVRALAREKTVQMIEVLSRVALNPKSPPAARAAAASAILDRGWGKPGGDFEGAAEALVIKVVKFAQEQIEEPDMKLIEGEVERDDESTDG